MGSRQQEKAIFRALLEANACFLSEAITSWTQPADERDFPDIVCTSASGRRIGIELGEWLHEQQMAAAKSQERAQGSMLAALKPQPPNRTKHVLYVWLLRKPGSYVQPKQSAEFKKQLFACVGECDSNESLWNNPTGHLVTADDLAAFSALAKHLNGLRLYRRKEGENWPDGHDWVRFPVSVRSYSDDLMLEALLNLLDKKRQHYSATGSGFDHLCLVVFYSRAVLYNTPVETLDFKFEDAVGVAAQVFGDDQDPFDSVFVFDATKPALFRVY